MTSLANKSATVPFSLIVIPGQAQPDGTYPDYTTLLDYNDTPPGFYRWNATTALWERVGEMAP